jgi:hypothetical protein
MIMVIQFPRQRIPLEKVWRSMVEYPVPFPSKDIMHRLFHQHVPPHIDRRRWLQGIENHARRGEKSRSISAILLERILGFLVLLIMGLLGAIFLLQEYRTPR